MKNQSLNTRLTGYFTNGRNLFNNQRTQTSLLLAASTISASGGLIASPPAEAAVQYSGLKNIPIGTNSPPASHPIDMDNDGTEDFAITFLNWEGHFTYDTYIYDSQYIEIELHIPAGNSIIVEQSVTNYSTFSVPARLPANFSINSVLPAPGNRQWQPNASYNSLAALFRYSSGFQTTGGGRSYNNYQNTWGKFLGKRGYLGVRFQISGNTHYGWIQFIADEDAKNARILDWAYEDQPDTPIQASAGRFDWNLFLPAITGGKRGNG